MEDADPGWEELRKEARKIEGDLDVKLSSYAKLGGMLAHGGYDNGSGDGLGGDGSWKSMEMEIESLLEKLLDINDAMSRCVAGATTTTSVTQKLARHRDILHEFTQEFRRTRGNIRSMREHAELLTSVRNDISEYKVLDMYHKCNGVYSQASGSLSPGPRILRERGAIHQINVKLDEVINQAQSNKGALAAQRSTFTEIQSKLRQLGDRFPIIRELLGSIKRKRSKDTYILSAVIAACTIFLIVYWISKKGKGADGLKLAFLTAQPVVTLGLSHYPLQQPQVYGSEIPEGQQSLRIELIADFHRVRPSRNN
ncbi:hypothetical protein AXG93_763s1450 [Marchantia polymorpha subsp. ruderalis]|uniref:Golgi SNAP receptor complex member 1 n=1 Tax=Marchantia polymorpha subsp. ruderalis TaxID=1480154 RepID=A0A176WR76_MARPO|nr:hypothetical protein AXG93_763s1450 [Marchantia polymorpha subsp. ruderalis]